jgi:GNAT superfamily N-acetyltransferase
MERFAISIDAPQAADTQPIVNLCQQLGYELSIAEVGDRLTCLTNTETDNAIYVARYSATETRRASVVGFAAVVCIDSLLMGRIAEIDALVVDENWRGRGVGQQLVQQTAQWAQEQGCQLLQVRPNAIRDRAHRFYRRLGFSLNKTQLVFRKSLNLP